MRVLIAGSTGVIGRALVPLLATTGHEAIGLSRSQGVDLLDPAAVRKAVRQASPDAVLHMATAIPAQLNPAKFDRDFALTNRLRTEGVRNLIGAATEIGVPRIITQGVAFAYRPGEGHANEDVPLWTEGAPKKFAPAVEALASLERQTTEAGGLVLRFGHLHGPGTAFYADGSFPTAIRAGRMPLVGEGRSVFSFTHTHDAATAIIAALDKPNVTGALNVVDDEPRPIRDWLPEFARSLGAPAPRRLPVWLARLVVGSFGVVFMNGLRGADNARARLTLDWRPRHATFDPALDTAA
ncbi:NAD-dependent epimerase/dehydratase family protein [Phytomonospora endophytica]|uniref:Nucleoside-diphosphate-sugar epimerase n=1 Tax=Phytomonospora endophytica TaxID=714109 RepID=A0A841FMK0_9ACTN|nr:NAD(P)-dependent oxidoreductase [Phytomonospora endophytica]MBB6034437.1 nucleoside-diphosphate-sugar epimerase [Phytomonospora endophytica]GIG66831.1 dTDP-glucose 4,6-dehydratase [Phytomonospora endophytica]